MSSPPPAHGVPDTGTRPPEQADSPVQELRAAAAKLLETAKAAAPGPWEVTRDWDGDSRELGVWSEAADRYPVEVAENEGDAEWIALANPALSEPMAKAMEYAARAADRIGPGHCKDASIGGSLLAVARAINGTKPWPPSCTGCVARTRATRS